MKMLHVTIYASDIDASIDFYQKAVGFAAGEVISPRPDVHFFFVSAHNNKYEHSYKIHQQKCDQIYHSDQYIILILPNRARHRREHGDYKKKDQM